MISDFIIARVTGFLAGFRISRVISFGWDAKWYPYSLWSGLGRTRTPAQIRIRRCFVGFWKSLRKVLGAFERFWAHLWSYTNVVNMANLLSTSCEHFSSPLIGNWEIIFFARKFSPTKLCKEIFRILKLEDFVGRKRCPIEVIALLRTDLPF